MRNKIISFALLLCFFVMMFPLNINASGNFEYNILSTTTTPCIGSEFEVVISLTNYADIEHEIRGLQIDVKDIDLDVFEVVSHSTMIDDSNVGSNKTSFSETSGYVRFVYLKLSGTMDKSVTDVMRIKFKVKSDLPEDGST